jgi:hypothetical protein
VIEMAVTIGHASIDENKAAKGGAAGDQTKKEVCTRTWYNKPWTSVIRPKDSTVAERIAKAMEQACANNNIGYDQSQRTTLYTQAKAANWDLSKVGKCECDCSSLVAVCVNAAGIKVSKDIYTGNEKTALANTGGFTVLTDSKYISKSDYLKRGDILLGSGHTAIVLSDGANATPNATVQPNTNSNTANTENSVKTEVKAKDGARSFLRTLSGPYKVTASWLNVRHGAGITKKVMVTIPKGTEVRCYGFYTTVLGKHWLYVQFTYKGVKYTGFASSTYLKK